MNNVIIVIMIIKLLSTLNCMNEYKLMFAIVNWTVCKHYKIIQQHVLNVLNKLISLLMYEY